MSLFINVDHIKSVLLKDGKWYQVWDNSFVLDSYEFHHKNHIQFAGAASNLVCATGFSFKTAGE